MQRSITFSIVRKILLRLELWICLKSVVLVTAVLVVPVTAYDTVAEAEFFCLGGGGVCQGLGCYCHHGDY